MHAIKCNLLASLIIAKDAFVVFSVCVLSERFTSEDRLGTIELVGAQHNTVP